MEGTLPQDVYRRTLRRNGMYKNSEGYSDPTAGKAMRSADRMPMHVWNVYCVLNQVAGLHGFEIVGLRDRKTGKEWKR